jgi:hypothetical protein
VSWALVVEHRRRCLVLGSALFVLAFVAAGASFWRPDLSSIAVNLTLLGTQAFGAVPMLQRIADLQAALDMRDMAKELNQ